MKVVLFATQLFDKFDNISLQDDPNFIWKNNNSKDVATLIDLFNLIHGDVDDVSGHNYMQRESWLRSQRSTAQHPRYCKNFEMKISLCTFN